jgi:hypothetical protein
MIGKGPGWSHSFLLIELFPDLTNLFRFHSQGALQKQFKRVTFLVHTLVWQPIQSICPYISLSIHFFPYSIQPQLTNDISYEHTDRRTKMTVFSLKISYKLQHQPFGADTLRPISEIHRPPASLVTAQGLATHKSVLLFYSEEPHNPHTIQPYPGHKDNDDH